MTRKLMAITCLIVFSVSLVGCATTNPDGAPSPGGSAAGGAVSGAVVGGVVGALCGLIPFGGGIAGAVARGAIAGAASGVIAGVIAGFVYGKYQEKLYRDRKEAEAYYHYKPEQGQKVILETLEVQPAAPTQGEHVSLNSNFSVLSGSDEPVPVEMTQTLMVGNKVCGQQFCSRTEKVSGSYMGSLPVTIPANAPEGKYQLVTIVRTPKSIEQKTVEFMVAKKVEAPAPKEPKTEPSPAKPSETPPML
jgi:hypothetical protein